MAEYMTSLREQISAPKPHEEILEELPQQVMMEDDKEIEKFVARTKILVVGVGGCGCNTVTRLYEEIKGISVYGGSHEGGKEGTYREPSDIEDFVYFVAINTDAQHLLSKTKADRKILIGKQTTRGLGAGGDPKIGEAAANESREEVKTKILHTVGAINGDGASKVITFLTLGLGGGTGTGASPVIADILREGLASPVIAVVTMPFSWEGRVRIENANAGLKRLREKVDTIIVIKNDALISDEEIKTMSIREAFKLVDDILGKAIKGLAELILRPGEINLDVNDFLKVMRGARKDEESVAIITIGESKSRGGQGNRVREALENALNSKLLHIDLSTAKAILVNVSGPSDISMEEINEVMSEIYNKVGGDANIYVGTSIDDSLDGRVRIMIVASGVKQEDVLIRTKTRKESSIFKDL